MSSQLLATISSSQYFTNTTFALEKAIEHTPAGVAVSGTITALVSARLLYKECNKTSRNFQPTRAVMYGGLCALGVMVTAGTVMNMFGITIPMPNFSKKPMNVTPENSALSSLVNQTGVNSTAATEILGSNSLTSQVNQTASNATVVAEKVLREGVFDNKTMCALEKVVTPAPDIKLPVCLLKEAPQVDKAPQVEKGWLEKLKFKLWS